MAMTLRTDLAPASAHDAGATTGTVVIKLGGSVLDTAVSALDDVVALWQAGYAVSVVHGGGPVINRWLERLGVTPRFIGGRRVTDAATLEVVRAVMAGTINTEIVRILTDKGAMAIGLNGLDAGCIQVQPADAALGLVGVRPVADPAPVRALLELGAIPVITPLGVGPANECRNVNADDIAAAVAVALGADELVYLSDVPGVRDASGAIASELTAEQAQRLIAEGVISGGMTPKIEGCVAALQQVRRVHIIAGTAPGEIVQALQGQAGTRIVR
jgi:acetylglutamate kinase